MLAMSGEPFYGESLVAFVELADARLHYCCQGRGAPLVLVSGLGATLHAWDSVAPVLDREFCVIRIDNRGISPSVAKRKPKTLRDYSCDIRGLLDHLGYDRAHILGSSLGGMIAQQFAMDFPDRVHRLVLVATTHRFSPYLRQIMMLLGVLLRRGRGHEFRDAFTTLGFSARHIDAHPDLHEQVRAGLGGPIKRVAIANQFRALLASQDEADPSSIESETLVVGGELDVLIPFRYVKRLARSLNRAELLMIPHSGHAVFEEAPDIVLPAITRFLHQGHAEAASAKPEHSPTPHPEPDLIDH